MITSAVNLPIRVRDRRELMPRTCSEPGFALIVRQRAAAVWSGWEQAPAGEALHVRELAVNRWPLHAGVEPHKRLCSNKCHGTRKRIVARWQISC